MGIDYEFLNSFCKDILAKGDSIRWVGLVNKNGVILTQKVRDGVKLLLTEEENEEYAASAIARQKTRGKFEPKIGKMEYAFGRYDKLLRATLPINENYYTLITFDVEEKNFDSIIMDKIVPLIDQNKTRFVTMNDSI
ncbi:MAG: hypothetical protein AUJ08_02875 [Thaumarchaeota archaeon 13_1_40CM_3_50_5]|nr:MAG: hypothetical protein AUH71_04825 [Thaumarchaeota archaeon 13_1_40CM_4_48_7]OLC85220.1 MAG: hypothetical protein AUJ08_02875 [Thaumarchaeota archaeon 13_1_40CM_3_50_5]